MDPRMQRLMQALQQQGLDPAMVLQQIPGLGAATLGGQTEGQPELGSQLVRLRRQMQPSGQIGGPLPDPQWDRFFGAMQVADLRAATNKQNFDVDPSGFGTLRARPRM